jgi:phage major head subunit gpT-like protein
MAIITNALVQAMFTGFRNDFQKALDAAPSDYAKVATVVPSSSKSNTYGWLGQVPALREWIGDRVINDMKENGYQITNKHWETTVGVNRDDIEDDNIGIYSPLVQEIGRATGVHPDELVFNLLKAGVSTNCYDGQFFFDTDHPVYPNADGTGAPASVSNYDDNAGSGTPWYLLDTSRALRPVFFQQRKKPVFTAMTKLDDESVFTSNQFRFGVDSRDNVGFGLWQLAYCSRKGLTGPNLNAAITAMAEFTADGGRPLGVNPTLLVVPPSLREVALETVKAERNASGATNINRNAVEVLVTPWVK